MTGLSEAASRRDRRGGRDLTRATRARRSTPGIGHIPEDRHRRGLVLDFELAENLVAARLRQGAVLDSRLA